MFMAIRSLGCPPLYWGATNLKKRLVQTPTLKLPRRASNLACFYTTTAAIKPSSFSRRLIRSTSPSWATVSTDPCEGVAGREAFS